MGNAFSSRPSSPPSPSARPQSIVCTTAAGRILQVPRPELDVLRHLIDTFGTDATLFASQFSSLVLSLGLQDTRKHTTLFQLLNTDKSDTISYAELASAYAVLRYGLPDERIWFVFHMADTSGAGTLTYAQIRSVLDGMDAVDDAVLRRWVVAPSLFGTGQMSYDTFRAFVNTDAPCVLRWLDDVASALHSGVVNAVKEREELPRHVHMDMDIDDGNRNVPRVSSNVTETGDVMEKVANNPSASLVTDLDTSELSRDDDFGDSDDDDLRSDDSFTSHSTTDSDIGLLPRSMLRPPSVPVAAPDLIGLVSRSQSDGGSPFLIDYSALKFFRKIGEGAFAEVFAGEWLRTSVAIKKFRLDSDIMSAEPPVEDLTSRLSRKASMSALHAFHASASNKKYDIFMREVHMMSMLRHPNLMLYMGACGDRSTPLCIVSELLEGGSLYEFLHETGRSGKLSARVAINISVDIARGMHYLHSSTPVILHRDLKSRNVLLRERPPANAAPDAPAPRVVICDFGLCSLFNEGAEYNAGNDGMPVGTIAYMAPDVLAGARFEAVDDVYSYGVLLWEIFTGQLPYKGMQSMQIMFGVSCDDMRPPLKVEFGIDPAVENLIGKCWATQREERPSFGEVISTLLEIKDALFGDDGAI